MRDAFVAKLCDLAADDPRIVLITGDLGFGVLDRFRELFPDQFVNAGVAEQNMTMLASGMALTGWKSFTYSIANFTTLRCLEQIRNDACYHDAKVTIVSVGAGFSYGQLGMSHFATEDLAIMRALPNLRVMTPGEPWEAQDLLEEDIALPGPSYFRIDKSSVGESRKEGERAQIGKARILREGRDVAIISAGGIGAEALKAHDMLKAQGISARVISMPTVKPLDSAAILDAARDCRGMVVLEEHTVLGGLGSAVAETCMAAGAHCSFFRSLGIKDIYPSVVGDQNFLRSHLGLDGKAVATAVIEAMARPA